MNLKRFVFASVVIFVIMQIIGYFVHYVILGSVYRKLVSLWRPDMNSIIWIIWLTGLLFSFLFVYIFIKGYENKGILEGVRYGIIIWFFMAVTSLLGQYVVYPLPFSLVLEWLAFSLIETVIYGILAAAIYKEVTYE